MPTLKSLAVFSILATTILSGCGGSGNTQSPLDPDSYTVTSYAGNGFIATSASGAFVYLDASNNAVLVSPSGTPTQLIANVSGFSSAHISTNGEHAVVVTADSSPPFELVARYFRNGVEQSLPVTPLGSSTPLMVDDNGFLYGQKPGEIYRTNGIVTELCTTPNNGSTAIRLAHLSQGENPEFLESVSLGIGTIPDGKWYEFKTGTTPTLLHDLNGSNIADFSVAGLTNDGTAFGSYFETTPPTSFTKAKNGPVVYGGSPATKVFGRLSDGSLFLTDGSNCFIESGLDRLSIDEITTIDQANAATGSFARGNTIFTYGLDGSTTTLLVIKRN